MKTKTAAALGIKRLYHYQSFEKPERIARIFADGALYVSRPRDFSDPWDCRPFFNKSALDDPAYYNRAVRWFVQCDMVVNQDESSYQDPIDPKKPPDSTGGSILAGL